VVSNSNTGGTITLASTGTLPSGTWLITGKCTVGGATSNGQAYVWIGDNTNVYASNKAISESQVIAGQFFGTTISYVGSGIGPFLLVGQLNATGGTFSGILYCTRIA